MPKKDKPEKTFDLRTLDYSLNKGLITQKKYDSYLKDLENDEDNLATIQIKESATEEQAEGSILPEEEKSDHE